jgi:hypothetical protein
MDRAFYKIINHYSDSGVHRSSYILVLGVRPSHHWSILVALSDPITRFKQYSCQATDTLVHVRLFFSRWFFVAGWQEG